jgi:hypothetical protein
VSRVQCLECGFAVVVDPTGVCPEGHTVGSAGVRIAGAMGTDSPHPDEPQPWVATVVLDESDARPAPRERTIRPVRFAGSDSPVETEQDEAADHESMLRELHALGDINDHPSAPPAAPTGMTAPSTTPAAAAPRTPPSDAPGPLPPPEQVAEGFAELSALEAAFQALGYEDDSIHHAEAPAGTEPAAVPAVDTAAAVADVASRDDLADLEDLFAAQVAHAPVGIGAPASAPSRHLDAGAPSSQPGPDASASMADQHRAPGRAEAPGQATSPQPAPDPSGPIPSAPPTRQVPERPRSAAVEAPSDAPPPPASAEEAPAATDDRPRASDAGLDIANFTAKGGKVGAGRGGRLKRFGR